MSRLELRRIVGIIVITATAMLIMSGYTRCSSERSPTPNDIEDDTIESTNLLEEDLGVEPVLEEPGNENDGERSFNPQDEPSPQSDDKSEASGGPPENQYKPQDELPREDQTQTPNWPQEEPEDEYPNAIDYDDDDQTYPDQDDEEQADDYE